MKKFTLVLHFLSLFLLISCQFTEEISFKPDGSGTYNFLVDMSSTLALTENNDSLETKTYQKYDSIVQFKDLLESKKAEIQKMSPQDRATMESLKDMKMRIQMDEANKLLLMNLFLDFKDISIINNMQEKFIKAQSLQKNDLESKNDIKNNDVSYSYNGKSFKRIVKMLKLSKDDQAKFDENMESQKMFLGSSLYKIKYNFPETIKDFNLNGAILSEDGKSLLYEIPMDSILNNPKLLDFEVKF